MAEAARDVKNSGNDYSASLAAFFRAKDDADRADGARARALKANEAAKSDAEAARLAYESVLSGPRPAADDDWRKKK